MFWVLRLCTFGARDFFRSLEVASFLGLAWEFHGTFVEAPTQPTDTRQASHWKGTSQTAQNGSEVLVLFPQHLTISACAGGLWVHAMWSPDMPVQSTACLRERSDSGQRSVRMLRSVYPAGMGTVWRPRLGTRLLLFGTDLRVCQPDRASKYPQPRCRSWSL